MNWDLKYKPKTLEDYVGQDAVKSRLLAISREIWSGKLDMPHLLLSGDHGVGKTTITHAFLRHTFGDTWKQNLLDINSSNQGDIEFVRSEITRYCRTQTVGSYRTPDGDMREIPYNFVFLDECDGITKPAQFALRRVMEDFPRVRFILSCNYIHKVLRPIQDRCLHFHFRPFTERDLTEMMQRIVAGEPLKIGPDEVRLIAKYSRGSARRAQKLLQKVTLGRDVVTREDVLEGIDMIEERVDSEILSRIVLANTSDDKKLYEATHEEFAGMLHELKEAGYSGEDVLRMMVEDLKRRGADVDTQKYLTKELATTLYRGSFVNDTFFFIELWGRSLGFYPMEKIK